MTLILQRDGVKRGVGMGVVFESGSRSGLRMPECGLVTNEVAMEIFEPAAPYDGQIKPLRSRLLKDSSPCLRAMVDGYKQRA